MKTFEAPESLYDLESKIKTQSDLINHIIAKVPVTKALASRIIQEVFDFIGIMLLLRCSVDFPRIGKFEVNEASNGQWQIIFRPSQHLDKLVKASPETIRKAYE